LKPFIEFNTQLRAKANNDFEKSFYKLMNNAVFGKTMENVRNRINYNIINTKKRFDRLAGNPLFKRCDNLGDANEEANFLKGVHMMKNVVKMDKPIICGFSILDLSKVTMYDFHYNVMKAKYGTNAQLLFTDTDSLCYHVECDDIYADIGEMKEKFDLSDYPKDHFLHDTSNKKVVLKMKDESNGAPITEFVGIRAKCYSYLIDGDDEEHKRLKGIKKRVCQKDIRHENYKRCIFGEKDEDKVQGVFMNTFRSVKHKVMTIQLFKTSLSAYDDKRFLMADGISSYAYGHKDIAH
jgi:hypothetical protein